jgi:putative transposase
MKVGTYKEQTTNQSANQSEKLALEAKGLSNNGLCSESVYLSVSETANLFGVSKQAIQKKCQLGRYATRTVTKRGGTAYEILLSSLPAEIQEKYYAELAEAEPGKALELAAVNPAAEIAIAKAQMEKELTASVPAELPEADRTHLPKAIADKEVNKKSQAVQEAVNVPAGWLVKKWQEAVAVKYEITYSTLRRWIEKFEKGGVTKLLHQNKVTKRSVKWDEEAVDYLRGLYLKAEHRKMSVKALYRFMKAEAQRKGWRIGGYGSALLYIKEIENQMSPLIAYRDRGNRGLDNAICPIFRTYADLNPFQIVVGDQHRFDFWVTDEETGKAFRPEGYVWQDLCTRNIYGFSIGKKYDSAMMGEALWVGITIFGKPEQCFTDNGGPETAKYFLDKKSEIGSLNIDYRGSIGNYIADTEDANRQFSGVYADLNITRRLARVRNAKSKMIEGTFRYLEKMLIDNGLPGYVHTLGGNAEENDIDDKEVQRLLEAGKLPNFTEFCTAFIRVCDIYNRRKHHKGLADQARREKLGGAMNLSAMYPLDYLAYRYKNGWKPVRVQEDALKLIFMARAVRKVNHGVITFNNEIYTHETLNNFRNGTAVEIRYRHGDFSCLVVIHNGRYICDAFAVERSSMIDDELTAAKNRAKRELKKKYIEIYKAYVKPVADLRTYSEADLRMNELAAEREKLTQNQAVIAAERERLRTQEELEKEQTHIEQRAEAAERKAKERIKAELPERPTYFRSELARYDWCHQYILLGGKVDRQDGEFMERYERETLRDGAESYIMERKIKAMENAG